MGEKNAVMDHFVFVVGETALVQVVLLIAIAMHDVHALCVKFCVFVLACPCMHAGYM